ncbi:MAG TPA: DUF6121 family protein [Microbacteriaceae bacterium]|nr:DUF6121 family protein [Microbacteriaceae bacterium]
MAPDNFDRRVRRHAALVALACGVLYFALIVAVFGVVSLLTNTEVVANTGISPFVGPGMAAVAVALVTGMLVLRSPRAADDGLDWGYSLLTGVVAVVGYVIAAFALVSVDRGAADGAHFAWVTLLGGYDLVIGGLAVAVAFLYSFIIARRYDERGRPRWTWEDDFDA